MKTNLIEILKAFAVVVIGATGRDLTNEQRDAAVNLCVLRALVSHEMTEKDTPNVIAMIGSDPAVEALINPYLGETPDGAAVAALIEERDALKKEIADARKMIPSEFYDRQSLVEQFKALNNRIKELCLDIARERAAHAETRARLDAVRARWPELVGKLERDHWGGSVTTSKGTIPHVLEKESPADGVEVIYWPVVTGGERKGEKFEIAGMFGRAQIEAILSNVLPATRLASHATYGGSPGTTVVVLRPAYVLVNDLDAWVDLMIRRIKEKLSPTPIEEDPRQVHLQALRFTPDHVQVDLMIDGFYRRDWLDEVVSELAFSASIIIHNHIRTAPARRHTVLTIETDRPIRMGAEEYAEKIAAYINDALTGEEQ